MADFSNMSDEELMQIALGKSPGPAPGLEQDQAVIAGASPDMSKLSDEQLLEMAKHGGLAPMPKAEETGVGKLGRKALGGAMWALDKVDSVTGAPTRAALDAAIEGKNPISAFGHQFGANPRNAPTGKTIAEKLGVSGDEKTIMTADELQKFDELHNPGWAASMKQTGKDYEDKKVIPSEGVGTLVDLGADWTNLVGAGLVEGGAKAFARTGKQLGAEASRALVKGGALAVDATTKTKAGTEALEGLSKFVTPKIADDYAHFLEIAKKNNISPELLPSAVEFGPDSFIARAERSLAEGPIGQARLEKHRAAGEAVQGALEGRVSKISGGNVLDEAAAGQHLRDSFDRGVDKFFDGIDWTHNMVQAQAPGLQLSEQGAEKLSSKLNGVEKYAKGLAERGVTNTQREQARQLLAAVEAIRKSNGSYKQIYEAQKMIGDAAFKTKNVMADIPPDVQKLRDIYFAIDDALIDTTRKHLGNEIADKLVANNKAMSEFFGNQGVLSPIVGSKNMSNEQVFRSLILNGDSRKIEALKKVLPPEDLAALKGAFLESLTRRGADGSISLGGLRGQFSNKKNQLKALFDPSEIRDIEELVELGERMGPAVLSSSGTGASNSFRRLGEGVLDAIGGNSAVDRMKSVARGGGAPGTIPEALAPTTAGQRIKESFTGNFKPPLSPMADPEVLKQARLGAAGAKVTSASRANEKPEGSLVDKIDANPELLKSIRNPNLRRQLEMQARKRREKREDQAIENSLSPQNSEKLKDPRQSFIEGN